MYFTRLHLRNVGPIPNLDLNFDRDSQGSPLPYVLVGRNGSGKSIALSFLVNTLLTAKQSVYEDTEVESGRVFKYRSPSYIRTGATHYSGYVEFSDGNSASELQLAGKKSVLAKNALPDGPAEYDWSDLSDGDTNGFKTTFTSKFGVPNEATRELLENATFSYFPPNRFEEPAWLNYDHLTARPEYLHRRNIRGFSGRPLIHYSPLQTNQNWLLDLILDRNIYETVQGNPSTFLYQGEYREATPFFGYSGPADTILSAVNEVVNTILEGNGELRLGVGNRNQRMVSVMRDHNGSSAREVPNLFQLSTGETLLLNYFLTIVRDFDFSNAEFEGLESVKGIAIIDEVDLHLHVHHQRTILPQLMRHFPNVQFIVTTHSPFFLMGLDETLGPDGFRIVALPDGTEIASSHFGEFEAAYSAFRETEVHARELDDALRDRTTPIVFVEGDIDIAYIQAAAEVLGRSDDLRGVELRDGSGFGSLNKIWNQLSNPQALAPMLPRRVLLLYDCDQEVTKKTVGSITKTSIPYFSDHPIKRGIENCLSSETVARLEEHHPAFIDSTEAYQYRLRGELRSHPGEKNVNKDEKRNLCDFLINEASPSVFEHFGPILDVIARFHEETSSASKPE